MRKNKKMRLLSKRLHRTLKEVSDRKSVVLITWGIGGHIVVADIFTGTSRLKSGKKYATQVILGDDGFRMIIY